MLKKIFGYAIYTVALLALFFLIFMYVTKPEVCHAGQHDSHCEGGHCHCYERFIESNQK